MNSENNVGISEKLQHSDHQMSLEEKTTEADSVESSEQKEEERVANATPPLTANSNWKALYRDIAAYAKTLKQSNDV